MGRSLAISSEQRLMPNSARNTQSDQKPRRFARKLRSLRRRRGLMGIV
jgi:hypothetical protein